jgi:hypothetical protein
LRGAMSDDQNAIPPHRERRKKLLKAVKESRENWGKAEREARATTLNEACPPSNEPQPEPQPLPDLSGAWWTIPEACIWISTRDGRCIAGTDERTRRSLFMADEVLSGLAARLKGPPLWLTPSEARMLLMTALGHGTVQITGRLRGEGSQVRIEPLAWANLDFAIDHRGAADHRGDMVACAPGYDPLADWWDTLRVSADEIRAQWPWDQHPAALLPGYDADGLPDRGEMTLTDAWAWCLSKAAAQEHNGPSRVAWKDLGDRIECKLFDAFVLGDLDCVARLDPAQQVWSTVPADWFRLKIELLPEQNKLQAHTEADMADFGPAWETVRLATDFRVKVRALRRWWATTMAGPPVITATAEAHAVEAGPSAETPASAAVATVAASDPAEAAKPKPAPVFNANTRRRGPKPNKEEVAMAWLRKRHPKGPPAGVKNSTLVHDMHMETDVQISAKHLRRAMLKLAAETSAAHGQETDK